MNSMSLDVVFDTDSEYHMHFTEKSIFVGSRQEISAHFWTFPSWLTHFHDLNIFFIFFLIFKVIFWKSMKNYIDLYMSLFGLRFLWPSYRGIGGPRNLVLGVFDPITDQNSTLNSFFYVFLIGKEISYITKCISKFLMTLMDGWEANSWK
jgi:hypothetical protein